MVGGAVVVTGGLLPANWTSYFVKSQSPWTTLLQMPDVVESAPSAHCLSRLTDQKVNRPRPFDWAKLRLDAEVGLGEDLTGVRATVHL